jgi:signal transduction histidine kinase
MQDFLSAFINRRYLLLPLVAAISLIAIACYITEIERVEAMRIAQDIRNSQERLSMLAEFAYATADRESEGRGYMLTLDSRFLTSYGDAGQRIEKNLSDLETAYKNLPDKAVQIKQIKELMAQKEPVIQKTLDTVQFSGTDSALSKQTSTIEGLLWMRQIRSTIEQLRSQERADLYNSTESWHKKHQLIGVINVASACLSATLLILVGFFITREIYRRHITVTELDKLVEQRTKEISELSTHLQNVTEREKSQLARELHDELGSLLLSIKMDLSQLGKKLDINNPDIKSRWQRIQHSISAGVELKRRVIEELRPTLLDNMGLIAALRWQAEQTCSSAGVELHAFFPENEPVLNTDMSIAIFRVAQEAFINLVKHASATAVTVILRTTEQELTLSIEDNGIGITSSTKPPTGSHGLLSMRHRMQAIGGSFQIGQIAPKGTRVVVIVPLEISKEKEIDLLV